MIKTKYNVSKKIRFIYFYKINKKQIPKEKKNTLSIKYKHNYICGIQFNNIFHFQKK